MYPGLSSWVRIFRLVAMIPKLRLRQCLTVLYLASASWNVAPSGLCRRLLLLGPRQWLPVPCGGCPRRPLSRRRLRLLGPRQWLPVPCGGCPYRPIDQVQDGYDLVGYSVYECFSSAFEFDF